MCLPDVTSRALCFNDVVWIMIYSARATRQQLLTAQRTRIEYHATGTSRMPGYSARGLGDLHATAPGIETPKLLHEYGTRRLDRGTASSGVYQRNNSNGNANGMRLRTAFARLPPGGRHPLSSCTRQARSSCAGRRGRGEQPPSVPRNAGPPAAQPRKIRAWHARSVSGGHLPRGLGHLWHVGAAGRAYKG